jgi:hypothetical protein
MKTLKLVVFLGILVAAVYVGVQVVPVYWNYYEFQDTVEEEARVQSYTGKTEDAMRETLWKEAKKLELPLSSPEQIKVQRNGLSVAISTEYTVHIDVPVHPFDLKFTPSTQTKPAY